VLIVCLHTISFSFFKKQILVLDEATSSQASAVCQVLADPLGEMPKLAESK